MKALSFFHYGIITWLGIILMWFYPYRELSIFLLLMISGFWSVGIYQYKNKLNRFDTMIGRVEQLKMFSIELQSLINKELALVQEDVVRTKKIVSESISVLQNSTSEINSNMQSQKKYLEILLADLECLSSVKKILPVGEKGNLNDVLNIESMEIFDRKNKNSIDNMMVALQFEDIVSQISERVAQHVGDIRSTVDILSRLCESELSTSFQEEIDKMQSEYDLIKEKLLSVSSRNLAAHNNMDEGDIELF